MDVEEYNFDSFSRRFWEEGKQFLGGPKPGLVAPDFDLLTVDGGRFRLSDFRGKKPVLLQFGSIT